MVLHGDWRTRGRGAGFRRVFGCHLRSAWSTPELKLKRCRRLRFRAGWCFFNAGIDLGLGARVRVRDGLNPNPSSKPRPSSKPVESSVRAEKKMLGGVAVLIARLGMRREVAFYCELNAPLMSRRGSRRIASARLCARRVLAGLSSWALFRGTWRSPMAGWFAGVRAACAIQVRARARARARSCSSSLLY